MLKGQLTLTRRKVVRLVLAGFAQLIVLVTVLIRTVSPLIGPSFEVAGLCLTMTFIPPLFDMLNDRREIEHKKSFNIQSTNITPTIIWGLHKFDSAQGKKSVASRQVRSV